MQKKYSGKFAGHSAKSDATPSDSAGTPRKKKRWQIALLCVLLVVLILMITLIGFIIHSLNRINRVDPNESRISQEEWDRLNATDDADENDGSLPTIDPSSVTFPTRNLEHSVGQEDHITNILLIGQDRRPGEGRARSDSMILVSFNQKTDKITMISFLRDNYVQMPGDYYDNRLNVAYALGGMEMLDETLELNFGVQIDANVEVDFEGFQEVIDILGGVDINLTSDEAWYLNNRGGWDLSSGLTHLDGEQALEYSRIRKLDSDFGRTSRQRNVLTTLLESFRNINLTQALALVDKIFPCITTDMTNSEIIGYVTQLLPMLSDAEVNTMHVPEEGDYEGASIQGMSVLVPDYETCREKIAAALK